MSSPSTSHPACRGPEAAGEPRGSPERGASGARGGVVDGRDRSRRPSAALLSQAARQAEQGAALDRVERRPLLGLARGCDDEAAEAAGSGLAVDHLHAPRCPRSRATRAASLAASQVPDRPLAMWTETTSRPELTSGS